MKYFILLGIILAAIILVTSINPIFASHGGPHNDEKMGKKMGHHHMPYQGLCAPGFAALDKICVLDETCGPGASPGKICMIEGVMMKYLKPLHQRHAGISVDNIICAEGKELMFKHHNAFPACVNSKSVEKLKHRGWLSEKPAIACTTEYDPVCGMDGITYGNRCMLNAEFMVMQHQGECMSITNFEECAAAGNPVMESHPRQCRTADGQNFVEEIETEEEGKDHSVELKESVGLESP